LDTFIEKWVGEKDGFFAIPLTLHSVHGNDLPQEVATCHDGNKVFGSGKEFRTASSYFIASAPHNPLVDEWLEIYKNNLLSSSNPGKPYFLVHCSMTQARMKNALVDSIWSSTMKRFNRLQIWSKGGGRKPCSGGGGLMHSPAWYKDNCVFVKKPPKTLMQYFPLQHNANEIFKPLPMLKARSTINGMYNKTQYPQNKAENIIQGKMSISINSIECDFHDFVSRFKPEELDITCDNIEQLEMGNVTGKGMIRQVHEATWRGRKVAVKSTFDDKIWFDHKIMSEVAVLFQLREDENIAKLIGWCNSTIILEYAPDTLLDLVLNLKEKISIERALALGLDVVKGVAHLHNVAGGPVAHGDIHLKQFLINFEGRVLLGDFEKMEYIGPHHVNNCLHKTIWNLRSGGSAPERMLGNEFVNESGDIYSVALVLWSLLAREMPYKDIYGIIDDSDVKARIIAGERPPLALISDYPQAMKDLIIESWDSNPSKRPKASEMVKRMEDIIWNYKSSSDGSKKPFNQ